jgi:hypothetical protein
MLKDIKSIIQEKIKLKGHVASEEIARITGVSRQAAHKQLALLVKQKKLLKIGKTKKSYYIPYSREREQEIYTRRAPFRIRFKNENLLKLYPRIQKEFSGMPLPRCLIMLLNTQSQNILVLK